MFIRVTNHVRSVDRYSSRVFDKGLRRPRRRPWTLAEGTQSLRIPFRLRMRSVATQVGTLTAGGNNQGRYRSMNSRGFMIGIPWKPETASRCRSPLTSAAHRLARAQAMNLSSSGSAHTCRGKFGPAYISALTVTSSKIGCRLISGKRADRTSPVRSYSSRISGETANWNVPFHQAFRIREDGPLKYIPETKTFVSRTTFTGVPGLW